MNAELNNWLNSILKNEKPDNTIEAFYIGIFESGDGYMLYLTGSEYFDDNDDDWACNQDFIPQNRYCILPNEYSNYQWEKILSLVITEVKDFMQTPEYQNSFLNNSKAIAVGFDDGDLIRVK